LRFPGITAVGETPALQQVVDSHAFNSAQVVYNMLNPSAASALPKSYPAQDYGNLLRHADAAGVGVIAIRVVAGGALSGSPEPPPTAGAPPKPIASAMNHGAALLRAQRLAPWVKEGFAEGLPGGAPRSALPNLSIGTIRVGIAPPQQFAAALAA